MADKSIRRWIKILFDRPSAKKAEGELAASMGAAGRKGGENFLREARKAFDRRLADLKNSLARGLINQAEFKRQADLAARAFNQSIISGMEKARAAGKLTDSEYLKLSRTLKRVGDDGSVAGGRTASAFMKAGTAIAGFLAARFGIQQFARFLTGSIREAIDAEDAYTRLEAVLKPLGLSYQQTGKEVDGYLDRIQKTTRFSDDDAREALVNLVTATGDYRKSLSLLDVTAKIAEFRHTTMAAAAETAANASKGLTRGMKDLGINAKDTGDLVGKINTRLGNLAEEGAKKGSGAVAQMTNLWKEFQEKVGLAIIGSDGLKESIGPNGLLGALIALNDWADKHSGAISGFVNTLVGGAKVLARISKEILTFIPNPLMVAKAFNAITGRGKFNDVGSGSSTTVGGVPGGGTRGGGGGGGEASAVAKARGAELENIERDIAIRRLMIERGLTEELAREAVRRDALITPPLQHETASIEELEVAWKSLGDANLIIAAGLDEALVPAMSRTESQVEQLKSSFEQLEGIGFAEPANAFKTEWTNALDTIEAELRGQGDLFRELGEALAEGGFAGIAKLAALKVKENLARAIEEAAKALGSLFSLNPAAAAAHAAAAVKHGVAAGAWRALAGGGGGGGAGSSSTGGVGSSAPNLSRSEGMNAPGTEVHLYFRGPKAFSPEMEKVVFGNMQNARERFGQNAKITVHREG